MVLQPAFPQKLNSRIYFRHFTEEMAKARLLFWPQVLHPIVSGMHLKQQKLLWKEWFRLFYLLMDFLEMGASPGKFHKWRIYLKLNHVLQKMQKLLKHTNAIRNTLAREWAFPGMAGFEHRIGGSEKNAFGTVSHDPENHQINSEIREGKVQRVVDMVPDLEVCGDEDGDVLVVGWGGTYGHLISAVRELRKEGKNVSLAHFNYIKPLPKNTKEVFRKFKKIIVCELNLGQFVGYLRNEFRNLIIIRK